MADTLATLIKLSAQKVEKVQQELAVVHRQLAGVKDVQRKWNEDVKRADASALHSMQNNESDGIRQAGLFATRAGNELALLAKIEASVNQNIAAIMARLNTHFAEQKRYEILHEHQQLAERKKHAKKVQATLDEAGGRRKADR